MDGLLDITLLVVGIFVTMSGLLYVLAVLEPQADAPAAAAQPVEAPAVPNELPQAA